MNLTRFKYCQEGVLLAFGSRGYREERSGEPGRGQESPGSLGEPRSPGEPRRGQGSPEEARKVEGARVSPGEPRRVQQSPGDARDAEWRLEEPKESPVCV